VVFHRTLKMLRMRWGSMRHNYEVAWA